MISVVIGLSAANLLLLIGVWCLGLTFAGSARGDALYTLHVTLAILASLMSILVHVAVFTYFMATTKWLTAAADKAALAADDYILPSQRRKSRALICLMGAFVAMLITVLAGAAADTTGRGWVSQIHMWLGALTIAVNLVAAIGEYHLVAHQGRLLHRAATILGRPAVVEPANPRPVGTS